MAYVEVDEDHVAIGDDNGEIIYWDRQEWIENPDLAPIIANAIKLLYEQGGSVVRSKLRHLHLVR